MKSSIIIGLSNLILFLVLFFLILLYGKSHTWQSHFNFFDKSVIIRERLDLLYSFALFFSFISGFLVLMFSTKRLFEILKIWGIVLIGIPIIAILSVTVSYFFDNHISNHLYDMFYIIIPLVIVLEILVSTIGIIITVLVVFFVFKDNDVELEPK